MVSTCSLKRQKVVSSQNSAASRFKREDFLVFFFPEPSALALLLILHSFEPCLARGGIQTL